MPQNKLLTIWKRKKIELESRIQKLESIREQTASWRRSVTENQNELLWESGDYQPVANDYHTRLIEVTRETAKKLNRDKQELAAVIRRISKLEPQKVNLVPVISLIGLVVLLGIGALLTLDQSGSDITGLATGWPVIDIINNTDNINKELVENRFVENLSVDDRLIEEVLIENLDTKISPTVAPINLTSIIKINQTEERLQPDEIRIGQPVLWKKTIRTFENSSQITTLLPRESFNISAYKIEENISSEIGRDKITIRELPPEDELLIQGGEVKRLPNENVEVLIADPASRLDIYYYTEGPTSMEETISRGKKVIVSGKNKFNYTNVTAFTTLNESWKIIDPSVIKIHWIENDTFLELEKVQDRDNNGIYDYVEWIVPHLSTQTFEIIIITLAEHLDSSREFISDIYTAVKELDGVWSEEIPEEHYVRVTFERELTSNNDITIYPRIISGTPIIEIYEQNGTELIAEFESLTSNKYHKVLLTSLNGTQNIFDLRVMGGRVELDHIIDPADFTSCANGICTLVFNRTGNTTWQVPTGVATITGLTIGGGGGGLMTTSAGGGGSGGDLRYSSALTVIPGQTLIIDIGFHGNGSTTPTSGGYSSISNSTTTLLLAAGGGAGSLSTPAAQNGTSTTLGGLITGGDGGIGGACSGSNTAGGGGGAGGYSGNGGDGGDCAGANNGTNGTGGGGGGGGSGGNGDLGGAGGGVGINGEGANGNYGTGSSVDGFPGSGGSGGQDGTASAALPNLGGKYGGGGAGDDNGAEAGHGGQGVVVITYIDLETTLPNVTEQTPTLNSAFDPAVFIEIGANATDNTSPISTLYANLTYPNGSIQRLELTNGTGYNNRFNISFEIPRVLGLFTVNFTANDTQNNVNRTQFTNFTSRDITLPNVTGAAPTLNSAYTSGTIIEIGVNVTDIMPVSTVYVNLTHPNGSVQRLELTNGTGYNNRFNISYTLSGEIGSYTINFTANDTSNNINRTEFTNFSLSAAASDSTPSNVTNLLPVLNLAINAGTTIEIRANVTDGTYVSEVFANLTYPNGSVQKLTLSNNTGSGTIFNISFNIPLLTGPYTINFTANDSNNNLNRTEFTNFTAINSAPVINFVSAVHSQSITEGGLATITNITFNVTDPNGFGDINNNSAQIRINLSGEQDRFNTSCGIGTQFSSTGVSFNCTVNIWYFDAAGNWTINVSINDSAGVYAENNSNSVEIFSTTGMVMSPNALTWATLELGDTNKTSTNDPVLINNTGNKNINVGGVTVTGYNLQGQTLATDFINAANFSIFPTNGTVGCTGVGCLECNGTMLLNATSTGIAYANITRGNNSLNYFNGTSGQEELFVCLRLLPATISRQTYSTTGAFTSAWTVAVS